LIDLDLIFLNPILNYSQFLPPNAFTGMCMHNGECH